jgi:hypothetical protein
VIARDVVKVITHDVNRALGNSRRDPRSLKPNFRPRVIAHSPARLTGMSIFVEARVD